MKKIRKGQKGFTLIELVVVIAILGVLAAIAVPLVANYLGGASERAYNEDKKTIQDAVDAYYTDPGNTRHLGESQYPIVGKGETAKGTHTVRTSSFAHPDDGAPITADDWNPLGGIQGANILGFWIDDGDGVRERQASSPDTWTTLQVERQGTTYYVDARYYFIDIDELVTADYLKQVPASASSDNATTGSGDYTWYLDTNGIVQALWFAFPRKAGFEGATTATAPTIAYSPSSLSFTATVIGANPASQTLGISNSGAGAMSWSVSDNAAWLTLSPTSGISSGETDNVTVSVDKTGMTAGTYTGTITISAPGATNTPRTVTVTLTLT